MTNRRMFLQTAGAALAFPLVASGEAAAQAPAGVREHIARELAAIYARVRRRGIGSGEDIRAVAANLRLLLGTDATLDEQATRALDALARTGPEAVFAAPLRGELARELRRRGVDPATIAAQHLRPEVRDRVLASLAARGASGTIADGITALEGLSQAFESPAAGIARVRYNEACCALYFQIWLLYVSAAAMSWACPICAVELALAAYALQMIYDMNCGGTSPCW